MKIVCFHVLNDYSGSPKVLEMVLSGLLSKGYSINLVTSKGNGALNNLQGKKNMIFPTLTSTVTLRSLPKQTTMTSRIGTVPTGKRPH